MFETLDKLLLAGLGALAMTRERAEKICEEYVARGQVERGAKGGFIKEMMDNAEKARQELDKMVAEHVQAAVKRLHLATRDDIDRLSARIDAAIGPEEPSAAPQAAPGEAPQAQEP